MSYLPLVLICVLALIIVYIVFTKSRGPTLISSYYVEGRGLIMKFEGIEEIYTDRLDGEVIVGNNRYDVIGWLTSEDTLVCVAFYIRQTSANTLMYI